MQINPDVNTGTDMDTEKDPDTGKVYVYETETG
jgi:hypothetical protein